MYCGNFPEVSLKYVTLTVLTMHVERLLFAMNQKGIPLKLVCMISHDAYTSLLPQYYNLGNTAKNSVEDGLPQ